MSVAACANEPYGNDAELEYGRRLLLRELAAPRHAFIEPSRPVIAFALLFGEIANIAIQRRVSDEYTAALTRWPRHGHIYCFRDTRDGDPAIVKIGKSVDKRRRVAEWRRALGATADELALLFSARSDNIHLAENVMHALLFCQWKPRARADTGALLVEYFRVENLEALRLLMRAVARHATWFTRVKLARHVNAAHT